jgi:hypothetical protein
LKKKYTNIGTVIKAKEKNNDGSDRFYLKLEQQKGKDGKPYGEQVFPITLANGVVLKDGDSLSLFSKKAKLQSLVDAGKMEQDKADFLSSFLRFEVCVVETVNEGDGAPPVNPDEIPF